MSWVLRPLSCCGETGACGGSLPGRIGRNSRSACWTAAAFTTLGRIFLFSLLKGRGQEPFQSLEEVRNLIRKKMA